MVNLGNYLIVYAIYLLVNSLYYKVSFIYLLLFPLINFVSYYAN